MKDTVMASVAGVRRAAVACLLAGMASLAGCRTGESDALRQAFPTMSRDERAKLLEDPAQREILARDTPCEYDGVFNFRDIGGKVGLGGRTVRKGLLYRSARFDEITDEGRFQIVVQLGVRTDLDLRSPPEVAALKESPLGPNVDWKLVTISSYDEIFTRKGRAAFARALRVAMDDANYPLAFHCKTGKDRTGTLAFVLLALLGVDEEDICLDWELTAFHVPELERMRHAPRYDLLLACFESMPGDSLREKVEGYVRSLGFTSGELRAFRGRMLE